MIIKLYVECMCNYKFVARVTSSLELYNTLLINELIINTEENLIRCAYWFNQLDKKGIHVDVIGKNNFTIRKMNSPELEELYK